MGCELSEEAQYTSQLVIEGYIYANEPIDSIIVRRTAVITSDNRLRFEKNAIVTLSVDGGSYSFHARSEAWATGHYYAHDSIVALPGKTYNLRVEVGQDVATAS